MKKLRGFVVVTVVAVTSTLLVSMAAADRTPGGLTGDTAHSVEAAAAKKADFALAA